MKVKEKSSEFIISDNLANGKTVSIKLLIDFLKKEIKIEPDGTYYNSFDKNCINNSFVFRSTKSTALDKWETITKLMNKAILVGRKKLRFKKSEITKVDFDPIPIINKTEVCDFNFDN